MPEQSESEFADEVRDRLSAVRIRGLFGVFDHEIPLNLESRITVVHGSNGVGKTIILRMIHELLSATPDVLVRVPYDEFRLEFKSGDAITVRPGPPAKDTAVPSLMCVASLESKLQEFVLTGEPEPAAIRQVATYLPGSWQYKGIGRWEDRTDGEIITSEDLVERFDLPETLIPYLRRYRHPVLERFANKCGIRLIGTDRLLTNARDRNVNRERIVRNRDWPPFQRITNPEHRTIAVYSQDLTSRFREALSAYGALTERLDRSLVRRLINRDYPEKTPDELLALFKELDDKRRRLTTLGLLNVAEDVLSEGASDSQVLGLVSSSTDVFSLYVHDMQRKLALFDQLQEKLETLRGRADQRFQFKRLAIDPSAGFVFESNTGTRLAASDLSSGEQHEMILLYELLFLAQEGDLVLIDEPEISLHVEWQLALLDDLKAVLRASTIDVLMATHSPAIARGAAEDLVALGPQRG
jgi:predicted ATPase